MENANNRSLEKGLLVLLLLLTLHSLFFSIKYFQLPYFFQTVPFEFNFIDSLLDGSSAAQWLVWWFMLLTCIFGFIQLLVKREFKLIRTFHFPLMYLIYKSILFNGLTAILSPQVNFPIIQDVYWYYNFIRIVELLAALFTFVYFLQRWTNEDAAEAKPVSKSKRLTHYLIDIFIVYTYTLTRTRIYAQGSVFEDIEWLNSNLYWLVAIHLFLYYFVVELLGLQTVGKWVTGSRVHFGQNRLKAILIRTLSRFIPFNAISHLGKTGWHDQVSNTTVIRVDEQRDLISSDHELDAEA